MRRPIVLLAVCAVALLALSAAASPTGHPICAPCTGPSTDDIGSIQITVDFHDDRTAEWRIAMTITNESTAEEWRDRSPDLPSPSAGRSPVTEPHDEPSVTVTDDQLLVDFVDREAAEPAFGGSLLVDYLHTMGRGYWYVLNVDQFTIHAPDGYVVANQPAEATVRGEGDRVTWDGDTAGSSLDDAFVVFAPADAAAPGTRAAVATSTAVVPIITGNLPFVLVPTALFGVIVSIGTIVIRRVKVRDVDPRIAGGIGAVGLVAFWLVDTGFVPGGSRLGALWLFVAVFPVLGMAVSSADRRRFALAVIGVILLFGLALAHSVGLTGAVHGLALIGFSMLAVLVGILGTPLILAGAWLANWDRTPAAEQHLNERDRRT